MLTNLIQKFARNREPSLAAELARLDEEATAPAPDFRAAVLGRAGDLCVNANEIPRALSYYGRAIDCYLTASYYDSAMALCEKVISLSPNVVRTRCTMAFLLLGEDLPFLSTRGISDRVRQNLKAYGEAAVKAGVGQLAIQRLKMMADVTEIEEVRQVIGDLLFDLGAADEAAELHYALFEERAQVVEVSPEISNDQRQRWAELLRMTIMDERGRPN